MQPKESSKAPPVRVGTNRLSQSLDDCARSTNAPTSDSSHHAFWCLVPGCYAPIGVSHRED